MRLLLPLRRFVVADTSMRPEPRARRSGAGVAVAAAAGWRYGRVARARRHLTFGVKRVASIDADGSVVVRGDNPNVSRDSRDYGPVPRRLVVGRVIFRYLPAERRGRSS